MKYIGFHLIGYAALTVALVGLLAIRWINQYDNPTPYVKIMCYCLLALLGAAVVCKLVM